MDLFTASLFLVVSLCIVTTATLGYMCSRSLEARFVLFAALMGIATAVCFSPVLFLTTDPAFLAVGQEKAQGSARQTTIALAPDAAPGEIVTAWTRLYGQNTAKAALLTTARFRKEENPQAWGEKIQAALTNINYQHLGGKIVGEKVTRDTATVVLHARIVAEDGISLQKEIYTLNRVGGQWLIDELRIEEEYVPGGKRRHPF
jgi:hypothetical protein